MVEIKELTEREITVTSVIEEVDDSGLSISSERCESHPRAKFKTAGEALFITYSEDSEGGMIYSEITLFKDSVTVVRRGAIESVFRFREGVVERSVYSLPPYSFDAEILTKKIRNNLTRDGGELTIIYDITVGGAKKRTRMRVAV